MDRHGLVLRKTLFLLLTFSGSLGLGGQAAAADPALVIPNDFPRFHVPGHQNEMQLLRELYWLHFQSAGPLIPLWDEWMAMSTLWPARGSGSELEAMRERWAKSLAGRLINTEGYVHTQQHDGLGHAEGWPFPLWTQAGGAGWHFRGTGISGYDAPVVLPDQWQVTGGISGAVNELGWQIELTEATTIIESPPFAVKTRVSPWLRINWWTEGLDQAKCTVEWTTQEHSNYSPDRRMVFSPPAQQSLTGQETRTMIPVYRSKAWEGTVTGLRFQIEGEPGSRLIVKSIHTACDTRHSVNNLNFIRGLRDYVAWTGDVEFLQKQMDRIRKAIRFTMDEFNTQERHCIRNLWVGHEGRSGLKFSPNGQKQIVQGEGIGSNYWDLLPFGGDDSLATIYYYDAIRDLIELESLVAAHPEWDLCNDSRESNPDYLRQHAQEVKMYGTGHFWNAATGRFGTVDLNDDMHDYGWTFLNNEAIYYDFATPQQARDIRDWISGRRIVRDDTSIGADIYHWRFGPRSSTLRNLDYYFWAWSNPESIPWGNQVQDGGAVLGFSYHDLMSRLKVDGPDDAWHRLQEILHWFQEVQSEGGYRAYYGRDAKRGTMQGGNIPGGLGLDREFFESILVPQVMLYGFLGLEPSPNGLRAVPRLPSDWPSLTIDRIYFHDHVISITALADGTIQFQSDKSSPAMKDKPLVIELPNGNWEIAQSNEQQASIDGNRLTAFLCSEILEVRPAKESNPN